MYDAQTLRDRAVYIWFRECEAGIERAAANGHLYYERNIDNGQRKSNIFSTRLREYAIKLNEAGFFTQTTSEKFKVFWCENF